MQIKLAKVSGAKGYQIRYCDQQEIPGATVLRTLMKTKVTIKKLDKKKPIGLRQELTK